MVRVKVLLLVEFFLDEGVVGVFDIGNRYERGRKVGYGRKFKRREMKGSGFICNLSFDCFMEIYF